MECQEDLLALDAAYLSLQKNIKEIINTAKQSILLQMQTLLSLWIAMQLLAEVYAAWYHHLITREYRMLGKISHQDHLRLACEAENIANLLMKYGIATMA